MGRLDQKVVIITGGASGIGEASVQLFVEEGARVVVADRNEERGRRLASECGGATLFKRTDVSKEEDICSVVDHAVAAFGRLDCMFNNAGVGGPAGPIEKTAVEAFDAAVSVIYRGVLLGMKHAVRVMKPQGSGCIISTASVAGIYTGCGYHTYSSCKAAVIHLTRTVAMEVGAFGIRVNCVCPGAVPTPMFGTSFGLSAERTDGTLGALEKVFHDVQAIPRSGTTQDVARAALWLAGNESGFVTGHTLRVDGGVDGPMYSQEKSLEMLQALGVSLRSRS